MDFSFHDTRQIPSYLYLFPNLLQKLVTALTVLMAVLLNCRSLCLTFQQTVLCNFLYKCQMLKLKAMWKKI